MRLTRDDYYLVTAGTDASDYRRKADAVSAANAAVMGRADIWSGYPPAVAVVRTSFDKRPVYAVRRTTSGKLDKSSDPKTIEAWSRSTSGLASGKKNLANLPGMVISLAKVVGIKDPGEAEAFFADVIDRAPLYTHGRAFSSLSKREGDTLARRIYKDGKGKGLGYSAGETATPFSVYAGSLSEHNFFSGPFNRLATVYLRKLRQDVEDSFDTHSDEEYINALIGAGLVKPGRGAKIAGIDGDPNWGGLAMRIKGKGLDKAFYFLSPEGEKNLEKHNAEQEKIRAMLRKRAEARRTWRV